MAGIDPETLETFGHDLEMSRKTLYLDYIKALMPQQRREAIFDLAQLAWGTDNPRFLDHPKLAPRVTEAWHIGAEHSRPMSSGRASRV